jgi:hypothetical protein
MSMRKIAAVLALTAGFVPIAALSADWQPTRPVEFVVVCGQQS